MTPATDPYRTLGLSRGASLDEIKRAYRQLAKENHPGRRRPGGAPAVPRDPGRVRAARRRRAVEGGPAPAGPSLLGGSGSRGCHPSRVWRSDQAHPPTRERVDRRAPAARARADRRDPRARQAPRTAAAPRARRATARPARPAAALEGQGHARLDVVRRRRGHAVRAGLGRRQLVRHHQRHRTGPSTRRNTRTRASTDPNTRRAPGGPPRAGPGRRRRPATRPRAMPRRRRAGRLDAHRGGPRSRAGRGAGPAATTRAHHVVLVARDRRPGRGHASRRRHGRPRDGPPGRAGSLRPPEALPATRPGRRRPISEPRPRTSAGRSPTSGPPAGAGGWSRRSSDGCRWPSGSAG